MERITHTILTIVEPLRDKMRSRKGSQWQSPQQAQQYLKGYVPNKEEVPTLLKFAKNAMKQESDKEVNNFENLSISDKESS